MSDTSSINNHQINPHHENISSLILPLDHMKQCAFAENHSSSYSDYSEEEDNPFV
jgi:hypothetical protein